MSFQSIDLGTQGTQSGDTIRNAFTKVNSNFVDAQTQIDGKADSGHVHDSRYYTQTQVDTALGGRVANNGSAWTPHASTNRSSGWNTFWTDYGYIQFGPANSSWAHIYSTKPFYFNDQIHVLGNQVFHPGHLPAISEVSALQAALDGKAPSHTHPYRSDSWVPSWNEVTGKPSTFTPTAHNHSLAEITNSETAGEVIVSDGSGLIGSGLLADGVFMKDDTLAEIGDVTLSSIENGELLQWNSTLGEWINRTLSEAGIAPSSHTHSYLPLSGGTVTGATVFSSSSFRLANIGADTGDVVVQNSSGYLKYRTMSNLLKDVKGVRSTDGSVIDLIFDPNNGELIVEYQDQTMWTSGKIFNKI